MPRMPQLCLSRSPSKLQLLSNKSQNISTWHLVDESKIDANENYIPGSPSKKTGASKLEEMSILVRLDSDEDSDNISKKDVPYIDRSESNVRDDMGQVTNSSIVIADGLETNSSIVIADNFVGDSSGDESEDSFIMDVFKRKSRFVCHEISSSSDEEVSDMGSFLL